MKSRTTRLMTVGAAAGAAGTALMQGMMAGSKRFAPQTLPPIKKEPGQFMVEQAERALPQRVRERIPDAVEKGAALGLAFGYGITFAVVYAATGGRRGPASAARLLADAAALGAATWAAGYLGWLPAAKLMPPIWKQDAKQVVPGFLSHLIFGVATVGVFKWLKKRF